MKTALQSRQWLRDAFYLGVEFYLTYKDCYELEVCSLKDAGVYPFLQHLILFLGPVWNAQMEKLVTENCEAKCMYKLKGFIRGYIKQRIACSK